MWCVVVYTDRYGGGEVDFIAGPFTSRNAALSAVDRHGWKDVQVQGMFSPSRLRELLNK